MNLGKVSRAAILQLEGIQHRSLVAIRQAATRKIVQKGILVSLAIVITTIFFGIIGCQGGSRSNSEIRLRKYFQMPESTTVEAIPCPILSKLPIGSSENRVYQFLDSVGIGKDSMSSFFHINDSNEVVCRVEYDRQSFIVVKESFGIIFVFDQEKKLSDIEVKRWLTGM